MKEEPQLARYRTRSILSVMLNRYGYHRYWLAEHHNLPGVASAATAVLIAHVAGGTRSIRVGSGGVMLPNHAPLIVAEQLAEVPLLDDPGHLIAPNDLD